MRKSSRVIGFELVFVVRCWLAEHRYACACHLARCVETRLIDGARAAHAAGALRKVWAFIYSHDSCFQPLKPFDLQPRDLHAAPRSSCGLGARKAAR